MIHELIICKSCYKLQQIVPWDSSLLPSSSPTPSSSSPPPSSPSHHQGYVAHVLSTACEWIMCLFPEPGFEAIPDSDQTSGDNYSLLWWCSPSPGCIHSLEWNTGLEWWTGMVAELDLQLFGGWDKVCALKWAIMQPGTVHARALCPRTLLSTHTQA